MPLIIDGYNLLNATGIAVATRGPAALERVRLGLLDFLADMLPPGEVARTTVVFDAREAPAGLPRVFEHRTITVRFAPRDRDADSLIEELILADTAPRRLTVVSSDHRVQRAARRRRARAVDSDVWHAEIVREHRQRQDRTTSARPPVPLLDEQVRYWLREFGGEAELAEWSEAAERELQPPSGPHQDSDEVPAPPEDPATSAPPAEGPYDGSIFPPDYLDALAEEFERDDLWDLFDDADEA